MSALKAEALFNFEATADVELGLKKGDIVIVRRTTVGDGWWEGEKDGKRGLFPSSYVKLLPHGSPAKERPKTPLTPQTKKAFMESLLTPASSLQDELYDKEKVSELFVWGHDEINITAGPMWDCRPPLLTVVINSPQMETRFSGMKHYTVYEVETKELGSRVSRKYKHFLWLYDRMAELFPCVSLPPLPVKQFSASTDAESVEARRRGLEKFLRRVASHPVLGSTKLFRDFLTVRDDKDWKIGRNLSIFKFPKSTKKMFTAPVYHTVKYPPFNVPLNQLASIERFSQFSRVLETNFHAMQQTCTQISMATRDTMTNINMFGKDLQRMAKGMEPTTVQRRKHSAATSLQVTVVNGQSPFLVSTPHMQRSAAELEEESSGEEPGIDITAQWNWRNDYKFTVMLKNLYDIANGMKRTNYVHQKHQEAMESKIMDALREYSGIIHTLPVLVKLHEEAMELYNASKERDSKKEAEEVRLHCEALNNILLSEFDYFSTTMVEDFEAIIAKFLREQANYHRQLAEEWDVLHRRYTDRLSSRRHSADKDTESFKSKSATFKKSGSYDQCYTSSEEFSTSLPLPHTKDKDKRVGSGSSQSNLGSSPERPANIPKYINVERKEVHKEEEEEYDDFIDEEMLKPPPGKAKQLQNYEDTKLTVKKSEEPQMKPEQDVDISAHYEVPDVKVAAQSHDDMHDKPNGEEEEQHHPYANWDVAQANSIATRVNASPVPSPVKKTSNVPKKPMPIQRKRTPVEDVPDPDSKPLSTTVSATVKNLPKKPLPPQKPRKLIASPGSTTQSSPKHKGLASSTSLPSVSSEKVNAGEESVQKSSESSKALKGDGPMTGPVKGLLSSKSVVNLGASLGETKPRSHTTVEQLASPDKKQPMLPPASRLRSKSPSPSNPNTSQSIPTDDPTPTAAQLSSKVSSKTANEPVRMRAYTSSSVVNPSSSTPKPPQLQKMSSVADATPVSNVSKAVASAVSAVGVSRLIAGKKSTPIISDQASSGGQKEKGKDELMRKLSLRRQRIEQQTTLIKPNASVGKIAEAGSERNSTISTSSSHSEVVVAYRRIEGSSSMTSLSSNSTGVTGHSDGGSSNSVLELRKQQTSPEKDGGNLAKYGIIEDVDGGSYVI